MRRRCTAAVAFLLTAFFAVAGAWHDHPLPKDDHGHVGLCSVPSAAPALESCAICKAAETCAALDSIATHAAIEGMARGIATDDAIPRGAIVPFTSTRGPPAA
jgi:hypothetical protein